ESVRSLAGHGMEVTLDHLGEDITDRSEALRNRDAYLALADSLAGEGLGPRAEMSVKLSAFGQALPGGDDLAYANVLPVVEAAAAAGTTVTLDMEDHTTVD
ncbi:proline dehydrogenase family protein, partial [Streptomyces beijiangensis]|nr:proline dehydrogenase [Streptomyces beijiangensis]